MATGQRGKRDLIVVSNRLPLSVKKEHGKITTTVSSGGLVTALSGLAAKVDFKWMGWPAVSFEDSQEQHAAEASLNEKGSLGIFLDPQLADLHYNGFSNAILWPILHYQSGVNFEDEPWQAYQRVNEIFADRVANEARDGHLIWIHDYHLMLLPGLLRARLAQQGKRCAIGFTFHTPFPAPDFWRALPVAEELLRGVLGSNVVGFHTDDYKHNFNDACERILKIRSEDRDDELHINNHRVRIDSFVIGINPQKFDDALKAPDVIRKIKELEQNYHDKMVIVGVDRLDHAKGLIQKLAGYELLLQNHPELKKKITLIQVVVPSREDVKEYQELETELETIVGHINGVYNSLDAVPLIYMHASLSFSELTALYSIADVCLIASRRDGMNLVASEFIACQEDRYGVLVLSELAGTAYFLHKGSILFHPSSASDIANGIHQAISMSHEERKERYLTLRKFIDTHTSMKWGETFLSALSASAEQ